MRIARSMSCLLACLVLMILCAACAPVEDSDALAVPPDNKTLPEGCTIDPPSETIYCTQQYDPVCGCNGVTYGNACTARAAGVSSHTPGRCEGNHPES